MKKLIILTLILLQTTQVWSVDSRPGSITPTNTPIEAPLVITSNIHQLLKEHDHTRKDIQFKKGAATAAATLGLYGLSETGLAHELLPISRSATSTLITIGLGTIVSTGGLWVAADMYKAYQYGRDAKTNIDQALEELKNLKSMLEQLKVHQAEFSTEHLAMKDMVAAAHTNATAARTSMEGAELSIVTLVQNMQGDMKDVVHVKEVIALKKRMAGMEELLQIIALKDLQDAANVGPDFDTMVTQATELEEAANRFVKTDDQPKSEETGLKSKESSRKSKWFRH
ncbi:MAG: hypothetical protein ACJAZS_000861 [Alteromonas naphthalenivorans]|jgi:hypothetical protein